MRIFLHILMALAILVPIFGPTPVGLTVGAWRLFGIFFAVILALIARPFPEPVCMLIAFTLAGIVAVPLTNLLPGYMDNTLWMCITAMIMSAGLRKSGLTERLGLWMIYKWGKTSLRLGYIVSFMDLCLATSTPASPARTGGIVFPLSMGIVEASKKTATLMPKELASYLVLLLYMVSMTTGSLFMTGMAPNLINVKLAHDLLEIDISWTMWFVAALPGVLSFLLLPWLVFKLYPPSLRDLRPIQATAADKLAKLGPVRPKEYITGSIFILILALWSTEAITGINTTLVGFIGVSLMLIFRILHWEDIDKASGIWNFFTWFGAILGFSSALIKVGFFKWVTTVLGALLSNVHLGLLPLFLLLALLAILPHYFFASLGGYVASFAPLIFSFVVITNMPKYPAFFLAAFLMVISSSLTHYGNALGPMLLATGYVEEGIWWRIGFLLTFFQMLVYLVIGLPYWHIIGLW